MSRQSTLERELLQVWKALHEVAPTDAQGFLSNLDLFCSGLEFNRFGLEERRLRGRSLEQRHAALDARAIIERLVSDLKSVALKAEAVSKATPPAPEANKKTKAATPPEAPKTEAATPPEAPKTEAATPPEAPKTEAATPREANPARPAPGSAISLRRVVDAIFEEGPAPVRHRRPGQPVREHCNKGDCGTFRGERVCACACNGCWYSQPQLELDMPVVRALPARGGTGQ